jgi:ligand-binding sensor domain-containing protein/two-component sensor histidine kinase
MAGLKIKTKRKRANAVVALCLGLGLLRVASVISAQQLSIRHYDVSDGLAHSHVTAMHQDSKGYLWLATWEGLSRFDGYRFINYTQRDGLGDPIINAIAEDRQNRIWVATNGGGVARLIDDPPASPSVQTETSPGVRQKFISFRVGDSAASNRVNALVFDSQNNLWCATDGGLYRAATEQNSDLKFEVIEADRVLDQIAFADHHGRLWFGMQNELIEIVQDQVIKYGPNDEVGRHAIKSVMEDRQGRLLVANEDEVFEFIAPSTGARRGRLQRWPLTLNRNQGIDAMLSDSAGALWIGTWNGLIKYQDGRSTFYTSAQGLSDNFILSLVEDRNGNLWIGTSGGGVCKLSSELIVSFTKTEGLPNQSVQKVFEDREGRIYASVANGGLVEIGEGRAVPLRESQSPPFTNFNERIIQDRQGDWWIGTDVGCFRFQGPELQLRRGRKLSSADGIAEVPMSGGFYEDPTGRVWIGLKDQGLGYFDPLREGRRHFERLPSSAITPFSSAQRMISDRSGTLWLGEQGHLGKLVNGRVVMLQPTEGLPETNPRAFFSDSRGWLWIGLRYKGVSMTKDPTAETPKFVNYSTANGLASDAVWAIAEDDFGRIYLGTGKGLDQLDLATGRIRHFNTEDGLASDVINYCFKDRHGNIWVGTTLGLSKFNPHAERNVKSPSPIYLSRVQVAGEELPLPETGASRLPNLEMAAARNNLLIEYVALSFQGENELRYQYKLEGIDKDWSSATDARSINYAHLAPGSYQFMVRAINREGVVTTEPALFQFRILPPLWLRWWFIALMVAIVGLAIYSLYRYRVSQLVKLERVRTRIAADLHDDIGANLSLIAMLSEVARGQLQRDDSRLKEWLSTIAATSRDTVDSMSDIVWAVNPKRDQLGDLTRRMRRFADDILAAGNVELQFKTPEASPDLKLGADLRREIFLIFKESINNMARHSGCTIASVDLRIEVGWLVLTMTDDGRGIDEEQIAEGTGLGSMRQRARKLGGRFEVSSENGGGTRVILKVPLDHGIRF